MLGFGKRDVNEATGMNERSAEELVELDDLQAAYKAAMEEWIVAIRKEEALVSATPHSVAEVDKWEGAHFEEEKARNKVLEAKEAYEGALRQKFFSF
jgi:hypothetical protein